MSGHYGQPLILSRAFGTSIPELAPEDIAEVPVPRLSKNLENDIADAVEEASRLRMEADKAENGIVAKLEDAIDERTGTGSKLRLDVAENAHRVMLEATGQAPKARPPHARSDDERHPEAVARGKKGGQEAQHWRLTPEWVRRTQRKEQALPPVNLCNFKLTHYLKSRLLLLEGKV